MVSIRVDGDSTAFNRVWFILVVLFNSVVYADYSLGRVGGLVVVCLLLLFLVFWWRDCDSLVDE